jgi:YHS domain-containing protein
VLCTEATRDALGPAVPVRERGRPAFNNPAYPITLMSSSSRSARNPRSLLTRSAAWRLIPVRAAERRVHGGIEHFFCSERCAMAFDEHPAVFFRRTETTPSE